MKKRMTIRIRIRPYYSLIYLTYICFSTSDSPSFSQTYRYLIHQPSFKAARELFCVSSILLVFYDYRYFPYIRGVLVLFVGTNFFCPLPFRAAHCRNDGSLLPYIFESTLFPHHESESYPWSSWWNDLTSHCIFLTLVPHLANGSQGKALKYARVPSNISLMCLSLIPVFPIGVWLGEASFQALVLLRFPVLDFSWWQELFPISAKKNLGGKFFHLYKQQRDCTTERSWCRDDGFPGQTHQRIWLKESKRNQSDILSMVVRKGCWRTDNTT